MFVYIDRDIIHGQMVNIIKAHEMLETLLLACRE